MNGHDNSGNRRVRRLQCLVPTSRRERLLLACTALLLAGWGAVALFETAVSGPRAELRAAVAAAEEAVLHQQRLLSRADVIAARYAVLEEGAEAAPDTLLSETGVLRELSRLAADGVHVRSVVPRPARAGTARGLHVALDCEGSLGAVVGYIEQILERMPGEVSSLTLSPRAGEGGGVLCRMTIKVGGIDA